MSQGSFRVPVAFSERGILITGHMTMPTRQQLTLIAALTLARFSSSAQNIDFAATQIQTVKIADGLYVLMGGPAQGNILVSAGSDGIFLVDSMYGPMHQKIMDALAG